MAPLSIEKLLHSQAYVDAITDDDIRQLLQSPTGTLIKQTLFDGVATVLRLRNIMDEIIKNIQDTILHNEKRKLHKSMIQSDKENEEKKQLLYEELRKLDRIQEKHQNKDLIQAIYDSLLKIYKDTYLIQYERNIREASQSIKTIFQNVEINQQMLVVLAEISKAADSQIKKPVTMQTLADICCDNLHKCPLKPDKDIQQNAEKSFLELYEKVKRKHGEEVLAAFDKKTNLTNEYVEASLLNVDRMHIINTLAEALGVRKSMVLRLLGTPTGINMDGLPLLDQLVLCHHQLRKDNLQLVETFREEIAETIKDELQRHHIDKLTQAGSLELNDLNIKIKEELSSTQKEWREVNQSLKKMKQQMDSKKEKDPLIIELEQHLEQMNEKGKKPF